MDKLFKKWMYMALILPFLDVLTTILFVSKLGINAESNTIGVFLMANFGSAGFLFMYLFSVCGLMLAYSFVSFTPVKMCKVFKIKMKNEKGLKEFGIKFSMLLIIFSYLLVYVINLTCFLG